METTLSGTLVGINDETWVANANRSGGRRLTLYIQGNPHGLAAPTEVLVEAEHTQSCAGLKWGDNIAVRVAVKTFKDSRDLSIRTVDEITKTGATAAKAA